MRTFLTIVLLTAVSCLLPAQEGTDSVTAVIRDVQTGEPIPYANVYVSPSCGTISNADGEFALLCHPTDTLRISCIGYQRITCTAAELPAIINMKPIAWMMQELTVMGADDILYHLVKKMMKEARRQRKKESRYFFRLYTRYPGTDELAETFMSAKSCVQLRDITFHSGNRGILTEKNTLDDRASLTGLGRTNMHDFLRLSPMLVNYDIWDMAFVPADKVLRRIRNLYDVSCSTYKEDDGTEICKIHMTGNPGVYASRSILNGTLFVDKKRCRLLRFDGEVMGLWMGLYDQARERRYVTPVQYTMHMDFRHDHGFTEIANISGTLTKDSVSVRLLLFNFGDKELKFNKAVRVHGNMVQSIDEVGFDSTLWALTGIVKRTRDEERVAFGDSTYRSPNKTPYNSVAASEQEQRSNQYLRDAMRQLMDGSMPLRRGPMQKREYGVPPLTIKWRN